MMLDPSQPIGRLGNEDGNANPASVDHVDSAQQGDRRTARFNQVKRDLVPPDARFLIIGPKQSAERDWPASFRTTSSRAYARKAFIPLHHLIYDLT